MKTKYLALLMILAVFSCIAAANSITVVHKPYVAPSGCTGHLQVIEHRVVVPAHYEWFWRVVGWERDYWGNSYPIIREWREWIPEHVEYWYEEIRTFCDGRCKQGR